MRKKNLKERELENFLSKKKNADVKWDELITKLKQGQKLDHCVIAQSMNECNWADFALMERNLREYLVIEQKN